MTSLTKLLDEIEVSNNALARHGMFDGEKARLCKALRVADEALATLQVAVNDKVEDKGATNFIVHNRDKITKILSGEGEG